MPQWKTSTKAGVLLGAWGLFFLLGFNDLGPVNAGAREGDYPSVVARLVAARVEEQSGTRLPSHHLAVYTDNHDRFFINRIARADAARFLDELYLGDELVIHYLPEARGASGHEIVSIRGPRGEILSFEKVVRDQRDVETLFDFFGWLAIIAAIAVFYWSARGGKADSAVG